MCRGFVDCAPSVFAQPAGPRFHGLAGGVHRGFPEADGELVPHVGDADRKLTHGQHLRRGNGESETENDIDAAVITGAPDYLDPPPTGSSGCLLLEFFEFLAPRQKINGLISVA